MSWTTFKKRFVDVPTVNSIPVRCLFFGRIFYCFPGWSSRRRLFRFSRSRCNIFVYLAIYLFERTRPFNASARVAMIVITTRSFSFVAGEQYDEIR